MQTTVITPMRGWRLPDLRELAEYKDLFYFLVWRDVKARYAQSVLGIGWAILQPVITMVVFTIVFGGLAKIDSTGVPYALFSFAALVPWTYFANALTASSNSLVTASSMLTKIYFPRLIIPIAPVLAKLIDLVIALAILLVLQLAMGFVPGPGVLVLPLLIAIAAGAATGLGMALASTAAYFRDVKHALGFGIQLLMYAAPVIYPTTAVPLPWRTLYALNPMVGVIEGFRAALLGNQPMPWTWIGLGTISTAVLLLGGTLLFSRTERWFADVI